MKAQLRLHPDRQPHRPVATSPTSAPSSCPTSWSTASPSATSPSTAPPPWPGSIEERYRDRAHPDLPGADAHRRGREGEGRRRPGAGPAAVRRTARRASAGDELSLPTGARWRSRTGRTTPTRRRWPPSATRAGLANSLLSAFERLTAVITDGEVTSLPPIARSGAAALPGRASPGAGRARRRRPLPRYAAENRMWADWIESRPHPGRAAASRLHDVSAEPAAAGTPGTAATPPAPRAAVQRLPASPGTRGGRLGARRRRRTRTAPARQLVPLRVDDVRLPDAVHRPQPGRPLPARRGARRHRPAARPGPARSSPPTAPRAAPRFPGSAPAIWNAPPRNPSFTGRSVVLERMRDQLGGGMAVRAAAAADPVRARRRRQDPGGAGVRAPLHGRLRPGVVDLRRADRRRRRLARRARRRHRRARRRGHGGRVARRPCDLLRARGAHRSAGCWSSTTPTTPSAAAATSRRAAAATSWSPPATRPGRSTATPLPVDVFLREESVEHLPAPGPGAEPTRTPTRWPRRWATCRWPSSRRRPGSPRPPPRSTTYLEQLTEQATEVLALNQPAGYPRAGGRDLEHLDRPAARSARPPRCGCSSCAPSSAPEPISAHLLYSKEMIDGAASRTTPRSRRSWCSAGSSGRSAGSPSPRSTRSATASRCTGWCRR